MKAKYSKLEQDEGLSSPRHSLALPTDEERKALISPEDRLSTPFDGEADDRAFDEENDISGSSTAKRARRRRLTWIVLLFSLLLISVAIPVHRLLRWGWSGSGGGEPCADGRKLRTAGLLSNGTHQFKKSALIVSIDGLRCVLAT